LRILTLLSFGILVACPVWAAGPQDTVVPAALELVPTVALCTHTGALDGVDLRGFAISNVSVGGDEDYLSYWLSENHSDGVAGEILDSYLENEKHAATFEAPEALEVPVLPLDRFRRSSGIYDWEALKAAYPEVQAIVRVSLPALDSQATYAVVHYEVIAPSGLQFANFHEFEKGFDGTWRSTHGVTGGLTVPSAERRRWAAGDRSRRIVR